MSDEDEQRLKKSGAELFKELLRVYDVAEVEDYVKNGQWVDELMRVDIQLVEAHRRQGGAPEPIPLSEVKMPVVANMPGGGTIKPIVPGAGAAAPGVATGGVGAVAELRLIALFVAKWKLDATRTKTALSKLLPARRRYVIANFKTTETGTEATDALDKYIEECDKSNSWAAATAAAAAAPVAVKRPISAVAPVVVDPNKRPRLVTPVAVPGRPVAVPVRPVAGVRPAATPSPAAAALAARLAAQRPRAVSPPVRPAFVSAVRPAWSPAFRPAVAAAVRPMVRPAVHAVRPAVVRPAVVRPAVWRG